MDVANGFLADYEVIKNLPIYLRILLLESFSTKPPVFLETARIASSKRRKDPSEPWNRTPPAVKTLEVHLYQGIAEFSCESEKRKDNDASPAVSLPKGLSGKAEAEKPTHTTEQYHKHTAGMDKIRKRIDELRIECDAANARAQKAEDQVKNLDADLGKKDVEVNGLKNKIALLETEIQRSERRIEEMKGQVQSTGQGQQEVDALHRRISLLENEVQEKENTIAKLKAQIDSKSGEQAQIDALQRKIALLEKDLETKETSLSKLKSTAAEVEKGSSQAETLQRKLAMVEQQLEDKERLAKEATEKFRSEQLKAEQAERRAGMLEKERDQLDRTVADLTKKYESTKLELEQTLKDLEGL
ncbi:hypothetical protein HDU93_007804 [Gonapodya sp. JEL0774]|nr:hypothetical protein HDU93_007804 [Gonapodya sp. JEL0774]